MKPETALWQLLKDKNGREKRLPGTTERIENVAGAGTPDVSGAYGGRDYWLELKVCKTKKLKEPRDLLTPSQRSWQARRVPEGTHLFLIVRHENKIYLYKAENATDWICCLWITRPWSWGFLRDTIIERIRDTIIERIGGIA